MAARSSRPRSSPRSSTTTASGLGALAREHLEERYATSFSPHAIERYCVAGTPAECAARTRAYADAGVRHLVFNPVVGPDLLLEQLERLADAVAVGA